MKRETAEKIVHSVKETNERLNQLFIVIEEIDDEGERKKMQSAWGDVVLELYEKVTREVIQQFPELDPLRDGA